MWNSCSRAPNQPGYGKCKLATECSPEYSRPRMANRALATHSLLRKSSQNRTANIKFPRVSYNPNSSPRGQFSPKPSLYVVPLLNPIRLSVHFDQGFSKNAMRPVNSQHQKFHPCLGSGCHLHPGGCREVIGN